MSSLRVSVSRGMCAGPLPRRVWSGISSSQIWTRSYYSSVEDLYSNVSLGVASLPLPSLESTVNRLLDTVKPIAKDEEEYEACRVAALSFCESDAGRSLHMQLSRVAEEGGEGGVYPFSYVEDFWNDMYLAGRWPAVINSNPFYILNVPKADQAKQAAMFSHALFNWWGDVQRGRLKADTDGRGNSMCMFQYSRVLGATQIPKEAKDELHVNSEASHIVVLCRNRYYRVDMVDASADSLEASLRAILSNEGGNPENDFGTFTASERDTWAKARQQLLAEPSNAATIADIDDALFVVCLDDKAGKNLTEMSDQMLHGGDCTNRWFDKHAVIVASDGTLGMNFNHVATDGLTWNSMLGQVLARGNNETGGGEARFRELPVSVPESLRSELASVKQGAIDLCADVDTATIEFDAFGKRDIKEMKMSPDAMLQMAFQVAYAKVHPASLPPPTYEACAMKAFYHGRTETIRSCTEEAVRLARAYKDGANADTRAEYLRAAASRHIDVAKGAAAASGPWMGVDRHLFALRRTAEKNGDAVPQLFADPLFLRSSTWTLSTSNVSDKNCELFGFGAVTGDGYGIGYQVLDGIIPMCITSYRSGDGTNSSDFVESVAETLFDFRSLLLK